MNILITGDLSSIAIALTKAMVKEKHKIVLVAENVAELGINLKNVSAHPINPANAYSQEILSSFNFDIVIYISKREELIEGRDSNLGGQLDGLRNILEMCRKDVVKRIFYVSSTEIYGNSVETLETTDPQPVTINGYTLVTGEQYCKLFAEQFNLNIAVIRVPFVYGPDEQNTLLNNLIKQSTNRSTVSLPATEETECSFLHSADIADFFLRAMEDTQLPGYQIINLSSSIITFAELAKLLEKKFKKVDYTYSNENILYTKPAVVTTAKDYYDWVDLHEVNREIANYVELMIEKPATKKTSIKTTLRQVSEHPILLKWVELLLGAVLMQYLSEFTGTLIQFKYVDFRLLFVVLMGLVYGIRFGLFASILASLSVLYTWYDLGYDWALLAYNIGNWFPFAIYFSAGIITGYYRDKTYNELEYEKKQKSLIYEKYEFLYGVFEEIRKLKDKFREQLIGYRDSFGKIYKITHELDALQEQAIYLRALGILEELMENEYVAIYTLEPNRVFARLEVNSIPLNDRISKSLNLSDLPRAKECIEKGNIFQNKSLLPDYPAFIAPIFNNVYPFNVPVAMVAIWDAKYEQHSTDYHNLFKIICNLIQDSLVRATVFMHANYEKMYIPGTNILTYAFFADALRIRDDMRRNQIAEYQLLNVKKKEGSLQEFSKKLSEEIRAVDIIGRWFDGDYYVLLSQADMAAAKEIKKRLSKHGIVSTIIDSEKFSKKSDGDEQFQIQSATGLKRVS